MKKTLTSVFLLLLILVSSTFADGDDGTTHSGGKTCPVNQTCLVDNPEQKDAKQTEDFFEDIFEYLKNLFG